MKNKIKLSSLVYVLFLLATLGMYLIAIKNIDVPNPQMLIMGYLILTLLTIVITITSFAKRLNNVNGSKISLLKKIAKYSVIMVIINFGINYFMNWDKNLWYITIISVIYVSSVVLVLNEKSRV